MFGLAEIRKLNDLAVKVKVEDNHNRNCSFAGDVKSGLVLHSAKLRNTVYLEPSRSIIFLREWAKVRSQSRRNALIESYFE